MSRALKRSNSLAFGSMGLVEPAIKKTRKRVVRKMSTAQMIKSAVKGLAEKKEVALYVASGLYGGTNVGTATNVILLNGVAEGTDYNTRIGRKLGHHNLEIDINVVGPTTPLNNLGTWDSGFWAIVLDRQPNYALAGFSDIFDTSSPGTFPVGLSHRATYQNQDRFTILKREEWMVTTPTAGGNMYHQKVHLDLSKLPGRDNQASYGGSAAGIGTISEGAILFVIAQSNTNTTSTPAQQTIYYMNAKYRFIDV